MIKTTSLVMMIGVVEVLKVTQQIIEAKLYGIAECGVRTVRNRVYTVFSGMLADQYAGGTSGKEME